MRAIAVITLLLTSVAVGTVAVAIAEAPAPAELLESAPPPSGFELATDELRSQGFDEFSRSSPYSVGHVQIGSNEADGMLAGQDVWGFGADENLLREVVRWSSADVAELYQQEVAVYASGDALAEIEPPFEGAQAFSGSDPVAGAWVRIVVWTDGPYGAAVSHFASGGDPGGAVVDEAAEALAAELAAASEAIDSRDAGDPDDAATEGSSGGGIPITTVLLFLVVVGGAIWLFLRVRKRMAAARSSAADDTSVPSRTDDIVDEARRKARQEVERTSDRWQVPDDF